MRQWVAAGVLCMALAACGGEDSASASGETEQAPKATESAKAPSRMDDAYDFCVEKITEQLKAPATAEFSERASANEAQDGQRFLFTGTVDSQNSFGALIRSEFGCEIRWSESAGFVAESAVIE